MFPKLKFFLKMCNFELHTAIHSSEGTVTTADTHALQRLHDAVVRGYIH
jgi:hypothetical protein